LSSSGSDWVTSCEGNGNRESTGADLRRVDWGVLTDGTVNLT
jgi:hypothetical protein